MLTRQKILRSSAATGLTLAASGLAAPAIAQGTEIKLGYVSPQSGPLAGFAESDDYNNCAFLGTEAGANSRSSSRTASRTRSALRKSPRN